MPTDPPVPETSFNCPHCQAPIPAYDLAESSYFCCGQCYTYFQYGDTGPPRIITAFPALPTPPALPLGAEGYLDGKWVRVTGILQKREVQYEDTWLEYVLMTKENGHQMLSEYNGHWMLIRPEDGDFKEAERSKIRDNEREYALYNRYNCLTLNAIGEFYWDILDDTKLTISEYIHPPYMLSREATSQKTEYYKAVYKTPNEIAAGFGLEAAALPHVIGVGALQPNPATEKLPPAVWLATRLALLVVVIQVFFYFLKPHQTLFTHTYTWNSDSTKQSYSQPLVSPEFAVDGPAALAIRLRVNVDNNWVELPVSLINGESGQTYEFTRIVEYYHGIDGGESWVEGAQEDEAILARIPSGRYHLNFYPSSEGKNLLNFEVKVVQNPVLYSNLFLVLALIALYPLILFFQKNAFEQKRWEQSDYTA
ncbi:hypothetical protein GCM10028803_25000 [Larkinella knui]|uniref:DUF4178 domain-containing protein n=1 Tax=Larkinella knui TaxID=2025310 RepID=A0A3P1CVX4_9BACT|nr:DUF4178 domain-containing protein [Larkinella knui]RRB17557.1 DUF4178 domain-containing protein [Larkinella knui]